MSKCDDPRCINGVVAHEMFGGDGVSEGPCPTCQAPRSEGPYEETNWGMGNASTDGPGINGVSSGNPNELTWCHLNTAFHEGRSTLLSLVKELVKCKHFLIKCDYCGDVATLTSNSSRVYSCTKCWDKLPPAIKSKYVGVEWLSLIEFVAKAEKEIL